LERNQTLQVLSIDARHLTNAGVRALCDFHNTSVMIHIEDLDDFFDGMDNIDGDTWEYMNMTPRMATNFE
jgi:hypothetical protein